MCNVHAQAYICGNGLHILCEFYYLFDLCILSHYYFLPPTHISYVDQLKYDFLIVAVGLKVNYHKIEGLLEALDDPNSPVATNFSSKYVQKTFQLISNYKGGNAIFTMPPLPIKCPGAPQKIMYLADDYFRKVCIHMYMHTYVCCMYLARLARVSVSLFPHLACS